MTGSSGVNGVNNLSGNTSWYTGTPGTKWVKYTATSGDVSSGTMTPATWYDVSGAPYVAISTSSGVENGTGTFSFSNTSGGAVLATIDFDLTAST